MSIFEPAGLGTLIEFLLLWIFLSVGRPFWRKIKQSLAKEQRSEIRYSLFELLDRT